jgi:predicted  nucleic acid-binding Zn-ribbon protein
MNPHQEAANRANSEETPQQCADRWRKTAQDRLIEIWGLEEKIRKLDMDMGSAERRYKEAEDAVSALTLALREVTAVRRGGVR